MKKKSLSTLLAAIFLFVVFIGAEGFSINAEESEGHHDHDQEEAGFKLSAEAMKNFDMKVKSLTGKGPWIVPLSAVLYSGEEVNLYRVRGGLIKRVDFLSISKDGKFMKFQSSGLKEGDQVVIEGVGFLRAAELVAVGGAPEGHSH